MNNFKIENNGITSIITKGHIKGSIVNKIVSENSNKKITIWQNNGYYYPCDRVQLTMATDLFELIKENNNWDILIIDSFVEWCNSKEIIDFLIYLKNSKEYENKSIIIFFKTKRINVSYEKNVSIDEFSIFRDIIQKISNEIFLFNKTDELWIYKLQDVKGNILSLWKDEHLKLILYNEKST